MRIAPLLWQRSTVIYRLLVAAQTIAWGIAALIKVVRHHPRGLLKIDTAGLIFSILCIAGLVAGVVTYLRARKTSQTDSRRGTVIMTWLSFQLAGVFALVGYVATGQAISFIAGMVSLIVMHLFSPNRLPHVEGVEA